MKEWATSLVTDIQGFKIEKILSEQLESVATTSCCQVMTRLSSTSNFVAYYSDSDISTQTQNRKEQVTALLKTKVIAEKVNTDAYEGNLYVRVHCILDKLINLNLCTHN